MRSFIAIFPTLSNLPPPIQEKEIIQLCIGTKRHFPASHQLKLIILKKKEDNIKTWSIPYDQSTLMNLTTDSRYGI